MTHPVRGARLPSSQTAGSSSHREAGDPNNLITEAIDPLALMQRVDDQALATIDAADGVLVGVMIDADTLRYVCGAGYLKGWVGDRLHSTGVSRGLRSVRGRRW